MATTSIPREAAKMQPPSTNSPFPKEDSSSVLRMPADTSPAPSKAPARGDLDAHPASVVGRSSPPTCDALPTIETQVDGRSGKSPDGSVDSELLRASKRPGSGGPSLAHNSIPDSVDVVDGVLATLVDSGSRHGDGSQQPAPVATPAEDMCRQHGVLQTKECPAAAAENSPQQQQRVGNCGEESGRKVQDDARTTKSDPPTSGKSSHCDDAIGQCTNQDSEKKKKIRLPWVSPPPPPPACPMGYSAATRAKTLPPPTQPSKIEPRGAIEGSNVHVLARSSARPGSGGASKGHNSVPDLVATE